MSDINWRLISEDQSLFEKENRNREILIETSNHSMHFSKASYVQSYPCPYMDRSIQQPIARYAYID